MTRNSLARLKSEEDKISVKYGVSWIALESVTMLFSVMVRLRI